MKLLSLLICACMCVSAGCTSVHKATDHIQVLTFDGVGTAPSVTALLYDGKMVYAASDHSLVNGVGRDATSGAFYQATDQRGDENTNNVNVAGARVGNIVANGGAGGQGGMGGRGGAVNAPTFRGNAPQSGHAHECWNAGER